MRQAATGRSSRRSGANLGIAVTKFVAFLLTGVVVDARRVDPLAWPTRATRCCCFGGRRAKRDATPEHPFGYGRERYIFAFIVVGRAVQRRRPVRAVRGLPQAPAPGADRRAGSGCRSWCCVVAIGLESFSFRTAIQESNQVRGEPSWAQFIRRAKAPELPVVLLEDFAALIGLVFALFGVGLTLITDNGIWDGIGTRRPSAPCWSAWRWCWRWRPRACCSARARPRRPSAGSRRRCWPTTRSSGSST